VHDGDVPKPRLTWLYRPGIEGIPREGTLSLDESGGVLDFEGANGRPFLLELSAVRKVKRLRASPVLQLQYREAEGRKALVFYYFSAPPELGNWRRTPITREDKKGRRQSFSWLEERNSDLKETLQEWVAEIRSRLAEG
jgi:hypothetical protein